ncbi:MAG TPA: hypothetical protein VFE37_05920 [Chloroflexota bacterium]|nr:hypothetical protein [Chloroflexota bacterium]
MSQVRHSSVHDADDNTYRDTLDQLQVGEELHIALDRDALDRRGGPLARRPTPSVPESF